MWMKIIRSGVNNMKKNGSESEKKPEDFVISCGGIQPIILPEQEEEEEACTEQF